MKNTKSQTADSSLFRVPPHDLDAEQSVLGAMLLSDEAINVVSDILDGSELYREAHRNLFEAIQTVNQRKEPVDVITLTNELKRKNTYEQVGGLSYIAALSERVPTVANVEFYANIVRDKASSRKLISSAAQIQSDAYADSIPVKEQMDLAEKRVFEATSRKQQKGFVDIKSLVATVYEEIYENIGADNHVTGLPIGIERLDNLTKGLKPAKLYIIGARPGVGKTALSMNVAWNVAHVSKSPVGIFSIEMTEKEITERLLCAVAEVDYNQARENRILEKDRKRLSQASAKIFDAPIFINDNSALTIMDLKASARRLVRDHGVKLLVVDYLQLLRAGKHFDTREQEVAYISMNLKSLAKDLNIPIVVASQLSRPMKGTEGKPPTLSDLRESGAIEQDADVVIFIHRWKVKNEQDETTSIKHQLMLSKQRSGPTDEEIPIVFQGFSTTFYDVDRVEAKR